MAVSDQLGMTWCRLDPAKTCLNPGSCMNQCARTPLLMQNAFQFKQDSDGPVLEIRRTLSSFAVLMEAKLRKNDHKTAWRDLPVEALLRQLMLELEEFKVADEFLTVDSARGELVDVANFCLILHDRLGMLKQDKARHEQQP